MRKTLSILFALSLLTPAWGQVDSANPAVYTSAQLDELVAPIALYPDPLVALVLPASTVPGDIVLADRYFEANGDPNQVDSQPWDPSVVALAHYPDVIKWMNENLNWTTTLGRVFMVEPTQVMESIQQLRAQARANGTLMDTPQQNVVMDGSTIEIVPAQPDSICVPQYDPDLVFADQTVVYTTPIIIFGPPCWVGPWLDFECNWDQFGVWIGVWRPGWDYLHDWRRVHGAVSPGRDAQWNASLRQWQQPRNAANRGNFWRPDPARQRAAQNAGRPAFTTPPRPQPMAGAPLAASRSAPVNRPAFGRDSSRPDTTGWRTDAQGHLAATPAPAPRQTGPQVILSGPPAPAPRQSGPQVVLSGPPPANNPSTQPQANRQPPAVNRPAPPVNYPTSPFPAGSVNPAESTPGFSPLPDGAARPVNAPPPQPQRAAPAGAPPASGALFGGYSRGTDARDFSNRGQASVQAAHPAPAPRAEPAPRPAPSAPPPRSEPPPASGNEGDQRKH